jgi:hypothetical protein
MFISRARAKFCVLSFTAAALLAAPFAITGCSSPDGSRLQVYSCRTWLVTALGRLGSSKQIVRSPGAQSSTKSSGTS